MERAKNSRRRYPRTQWRKATRSTEEKGREEEKECVKSKQGQKKHEKIEEGIRSSQRMSVEGENPIQRSDCSKTENEEEKKVRKTATNGRTKERRRSIWMT